MPGTDRNGATRYIARVEEELKKNPLEVSETEPVFVSASFGVASYSELGWEETVEDLLQRGDRELYGAKNAKPHRISRT